MTGEAIDTWLQPVRPVLDPADQVDWDRLAALETELDEVLAIHSVDLPDGPERSRRLMAVRLAMVERGFLDSMNSPLFGVLAQFLCGYRDVDLRDAVTLGYGRLITQHGRAALRQRWGSSLAAGALVGVAITEPHGGSRPAAARTRATPGPDGTWLVSGRKTWISRLDEASAFVVFFQAPEGGLVAAAIDAAEPGLYREPVSPAGLAGWTWGVLDLDAVPVHPDRDVLRGDGMALLRRHFTAYRPLVTATALGAAAAVFDAASTHLMYRRSSGDLPRLRDSALVALGRTHAQLTTALLGTAVAARLAHAEADWAEQWGWEMKAHGVDTACQAAAELAQLLGASGYRADSPVAKARRDLGALQFADGIHDSLYRSSGKRHTTPRPAMTEPPLRPLARSA
ncbi:acyl-CoA dehydrogenase family protein [Actinomadura sp. WMMA1423]|uniref:acyl-CoA dehydrogenase family protein n=1 Tax=Actinomadura sp. WMMA1423 TaxID=2591108 RepID=UPI0011465110|nr:acyl-CoA dehydrogenase family protein [Actinomadura sp. WMMA1423]